MKRSTTRWTTAFAAAALLGLPAAGLTQTPPATTSPAPTAQPAPRAQGQEGSAQDHIRQAKAALDDVQTASLAARSKTRISELKRHLGSLEKSASSAGTGAAAGAKTTARAKSNWASEVAAIDKILTELLGPATTSPAGAPTGATGTTGKPASPATLDDATKGKLMEVRTHVTAFAAAMSGGAPSPSPEPATDAAAQPSSASQPSAASPAAQPQEAASTPAEQSQPQGQIDAAAAKQHLMAARDSLSQLTQLPAAAQLAGETRTQVSQLIANFNEMIGATTNWREAYNKVNANLTALVGAESASSASVEQPAQPSPTGTPGAVGTTGVAAGGLDPTLRAKLVEFREHLMKFEQAAGGGSATSETPSSNGATTAPSASSPSASSPSSPAPSAASSPAPSTTPAEQTPATTGPQNPPATTATTAPRPDATTQSSAVRHIEAIEAILSGRPASSSTSSGSNPAAATPPAAATAGTSGASASVTLNASQLEQIRRHLSELRKAVDKK